MFNFNHNITDDISFAGILGTNIRRNEYQSVFASTAGGLLIDGLYSLQNGIDAAPNAQEIAQKIGVDGVYGSVSFGLGHILYLDATIRRDNFSTLPSDNSSVYYPSVSTSFVFSKLLDVSAINFGKLRANYMTHILSITILEHLYQLQETIQNLNQSVQRVTRLDWKCVSQTVVLDLM